MTDGGLFDVCADRFELVFRFRFVVVCFAAAVVVDVLSCFVSVFFFFCSIRNLYRVPVE